MNQNYSPDDSVQISDKEITFEFYENQSVLLFVVSHNIAIFTKKEILFRSHNIKKRKFERILPYKTHHNLEGKVTSSGQVIIAGRSTFYCPVNRLRVGCNHHLILVYLP